MGNTVAIIGAGLAGSEAALQLADRGFRVKLYEMRPKLQTPVHTSGFCAELVCSNSLKSMKAHSAAGMLKNELKLLSSHLLDYAYKTQIEAGGALAVDREAFARMVSNSIEEHPLIELIREEVVELPQENDALILASGPLTSDRLAQTLKSLSGIDNLSFYDAAAPIIMADSIDHSKVFRQNRYEDTTQGDYLNAPFNKEEYESFIENLQNAERVISKDFETKELFQACSPIEEIARKGLDAPRFGPLKPVGLINPMTGHRPWAALQLRAEDRNASSYNLVGFQTNLRFSEQERVFRMIPGLENAEFTRYGVMHRNTFLNAPKLIDKTLKLKSEVTKEYSMPLYIAGQLGGTEGYCEAIMAGLIAALRVTADLKGIALPALPKDTAFGALLDYASDPETKHYQPMHVNFGLMPPLPMKLKNKKLRYAAYAERGEASMVDYVSTLESLSLLIEDSVELKQSLAGLDQEVLGDMQGGDEPLCDFRETLDEADKDNV